MYRRGLRQHNRARCLALSLALLCGIGSALAAGPEVGETVPDFEAVDQSGKARNFASLTGERGLLLLFFRSADW